MARQSAIQTHTHTHTYTHLHIFTSILYKCLFSKGKKTGNKSTWCDKICFFNAASCSMKVPQVKIRTKRKQQRICLTAMIDYADTS